MMNGTNLMSLYITRQLCQLCQSYVLYGELVVGTIHTHSELEVAQSRQGASRARVRASLGLGLGLGLAQARQKQVITQDLHFLYPYY